MRRLPCLAIPALLLLVPVVAGLPPAQAARIPSPRSVALRSHDLPAGYREVSAHLYSVSEAARLDHVRVTTFLRHGRLQSYKASFQGKYLSGLYKVVNLVAAFRTSAGARWDYLRTVGSAKRSASRHRGYRRVRIGRIGKDSAAFTFDGSVRKLPAVVDIIRFDDRSFRVTVEATGMEGSVKRSSLLAYTVYLAEIVNRRIRRGR